MIVLWIQIVFYLKIGFDRIIDLEQSDLSKTFQTV